MYEYIKSLIIITAFIMPFTSSGKGLGANISEERDINQSVFDANFTLIDSTETTLLTLTKQKPVILALIFTKCSGICSPFITQLKREIQKVEQKGDYQILVVSFDPSDSIKHLEKMAKGYKLDQNTTWRFAINKDIDALNKSISFEPIWDEERQQFDHDALLVGINSEGYITKKLIGIRGQKDLELMIKSINNEFIPSYRLPTESSLFTCFEYNPKTGKVKPGTGLIFLFAPAFLSVLIMIVIRMYVRK